jgi:Cu/Ag efflux protein CusF
MGRRVSAAWLIVAVSALSGCASYTPPPLPPGHPARVDEPTSPDPAPSRTLAYTQADIPSVDPVPSIAATTHGGHAASSPERHPRTVVGEGEVVSTVPNASQIVVDHGVIEGFMEAMTMGYRVDPPSLLGGLQAGDKVRFTIDVQRRAIVRIEKLP